MSKDEKQTKPEQIDEKDLDKAAGGFSFGVENPTNLGSVVGKKKTIGSGTDG